MSDENVVDYDDDDGHDEEDGGDDDDHGPGRSGRPPGLTVTPFSRTPRGTEVARAGLLSLYPNHEPTPVLLAS